MAATEKFNFSLIYNEKSISFLNPLFDTISIITTMLTTLLIWVIISKTPKEMKSFKTYLLPYSCLNLSLGLILGHLSPIILHPYICFYPIGFAKHLPPIIPLALIALGFTISMAIIDSSTGMSLERFFAMRNMSSSKIPFRCYSFLIFTDAATFAFMLICISVPFLKQIFFLSNNELMAFWGTKFTDFDFINPALAVMIRGTEKTNLSYPIILIAISAISRLSLALTVLTLNFCHFRNLKFKVFKTLQKSNTMLLRMIFIQFFGMSIFFGLSGSIVLFSLNFITHPSMIPNFAFLIMNLYVPYDSLIIIIFLKPYRKFFIRQIQKIFCCCKKNFVVRDSAAFPLRE